MKASYTSPPPKNRHSSLRIRGSLKNSSTLSLKTRYFEKHDIYPSCKFTLKKKKREKHTSKWNARRMNNHESKAISPLTRGQYRISGVKGGEKREKGELFFFRLRVGDICISEITGWFPWRRVPVYVTYTRFSRRAIGANDRRGDARIRFFARAE